MKTACLNGEIDKEIYVQQPLGFEVLEDGKILIYKLEKKLLYGLEQSGRNWFFTLAFLTSVGFKGSKSDPCLFLRHREAVTDYVACWVDDLVYCSIDEKYYKKFKLVLRKNFSGSEISNLSWFLGIDANWKRCSLYQDLT